MRNMSKETRPHDHVLTRRQFVVSGTAATAALAFLAGCGGTGDAGASDGGYKDSMIVTTKNDQDTLDPQVNVTNDKVLRLLYSGLLTTNPETSEVEPAIAESWEHSDDGLTWTFHLRDDVTFGSSGKTLTSADVKATFDRLINKDHPLRYSDTVNFLESVEAPDDTTVVMTMNSTNGCVEDTFARQCCFIMNKDYIDQYGYDLGIDVASIDGTGPFKVTQWDPDEQMVFEANDAWFAGEPGVRNFTLTFMPEASIRVMAIENCEVDIVDGPSIDDVERVDAEDGLSVLSEPGYGLHGFQFNCSEYSKCHDTLVRQAISYAIDRETIVSSLFGSIGETATHGPLVPKNRGYVDLGVAPYDPDKAKELLAQAGHADGLDISIMTTAVYTKGVEMAEAVKQQLAEVGVNATIETVDSATFSAAFNGITPEEMSWDMFIMGFGGSGLDPDPSLRRICVTSSDGLNTNNYGWYSNERVDELLNTAITLVDQEKRMEMYKEAQQIIYLDDPFAVYMDLRNSLYVYTDKVENLSLDATAVPMYEGVKVRA